MIDDATSLEKRRNGIRLIELLIVIVVIGALATIAMPRLAHTRSRPYVGALKSDLRTLATLQAAFFADSSRYSDSVTNLGFRRTIGTVPPAVISGSAYWSATNSHIQLTGTTCGIAVGTADPVVAKAREGEVACSP